MHPINTCVPSLGLLCSFALLVHLSFAAGWQQRHIAFSFDRKHQEANWTRFAGLVEESPHQNPIFRCGSMILLVKKHFALRLYGISITLIPKAIDVGVVRSWGDQFQQLSQFLSEKSTGCNHFNLSKCENILLQHKSTKVQKSITYLLNASCSCHQGCSGWHELQYTLNTLTSRLNPHSAILVPPPSVQLPPVLVSILVVRVRCALQQQMPLSTLGLAAVVASWAKPTPGTASVA